LIDGIHACMRLHSCGLRATPTVFYCFMRALALVSISFMAINSRCSRKLTSLRISAFFELHELFCGIHLYAYNTRQRVILLSVLCP